VHSQCSICLIHLLLILLLFLCPIRSLNVRGAAGGTSAYTTPRTVTSLFQTFTLFDLLSSLSPLLLVLYIIAALYSNINYVHNLFSRLLNARFIGVRVAAGVTSAHAHLLLRPQQPQSPARSRQDPICALLCGQWWCRRGRCGQACRTGGIHIHVAAASHVGLVLVCMYTIPTFRIHSQLIIIESLPV